jgi:hypothetical protein
MQQLRESWAQATSTKLYVVIVNRLARSYINEQMTRFGDDREAKTHLLFLAKLDLTFTS